jgi:HlyD family secretion protein
MNVKPLLDKLRSPSRRLPLLLGLAVVGVVILLSFWLRSSKAGENSTASYEVTRGDFAVTVVEGGSLAAVTEVSIRNEVEGTARIISIVPEGTYVKQGDLLVELDSAQAQDQVSQQQIAYEKAVFAVEQARAQLEIQRSTTNSDFLTAQMKLKFAEIDRDKYEQGQRLVDLMEATNKLTAAEAQLVVNSGSLSNTILLHDKGYETKEKLDSDWLTVLNNRNLVIVASNAIRMLSHFDVPKQTNKFYSDAELAREELYRVVNQNLRRMAQYEADLNAQSNTLVLGELKLARDRRNLTNTIIRAPQDGLVVYAVSDSHFSSESLIEGGATVRNRQELIKLPDLSRMKVNIMVHESHINTIQPGLPAFVVLDSLPDQRFAGVVEKVAPLPDTQARWGNPNLKVYNTEVLLTEPLPNVKPGVSARAEIIITNIANALSVPIQAVTTYKGKQVVYVMNGAKSEPRLVETGMYNTKSLEITQGLKEGERVLLSPPFELQEKDLDGGVLADDEKRNAPAAKVLPAGAGGAGERSGDARRPGTGPGREDTGEASHQDGDEERDENQRDAPRQSSDGVRPNQAEPRRDTGPDRSPPLQGARPDGAAGERLEGGSKP